MTLAIEYLPVGDLTENPRNSRTHDPDQIVMIADSIRRFGFTNPVLIDENGVLIAGHGRLAGAKLAGLAEVPCVRLPYLTDEEKRAYLIADNRIAEKSGWDEEILRSELDALLDFGFDEALLGFTEDEIDLLAGDFTGDHEDLVTDSGSAAVRDDADGEAGKVAPKQKAPPMRIPVLIELSHAELKRWSGVKKRIGIQDNSAAFKNVAGIQIDGENT